MQKFIVVTLQLVGHLFVFALVGGIGYLMWILLERHRADDDDENISSTAPILTAVIINAIVLVCPLIFRLIGRLVLYQ